MDQQITQQLTGLLQQMLQVLQSTGGDPTADPNAADDGTDMDAPPTDGMDDDASPAAPGMDDDMGGGASLHDRVSKIEQHTGLKKSAGAPLAARVDTLEEAYLGEMYEGEMSDRIAQLEEAILTKSATVEKPAPVVEDEAPAEIPLGDLIKAATSAAVKEAMDAIAPLLQKSAQDDDGLPDLSKLRGAPRVGDRKAQRAVGGDDAALVKAANAWGYNDSELDQPFTFGDALQAQWNAQQNGTTLFSDDDD